MRKLLKASLVLTLALTARAAFAQGSAGSHGFVGDNLQASGATAAMPAASSRDWQQSTETKAQSKWKRGHFGKKKPAAKKSAKSHHPPPRKPKKP